MDDVAALVKLTAASLDDIAAAAGKAGSKSLGVVVDDTAVTPRYVQGVTAERELPIIRRIALGSLRNKLLIILPVALLLSQFLPWLLTPILMLGGAYLCFEGAEKVWEIVGSHDGERHDLPVAAQGPEQENTMVRGAIRTDFILSAEIMVIALNEVAEEPLVTRGIVLALVGVVITVLVYGVVAVIVKMDDVGLYLAQRDSAALRRIGRALVRAMPVLLRVLSAVGIAAMLWVGGHILLVGMDELGWSWLYEAVHHAEEAVSGALPAIAGAAGWLTNTVSSAVLGLAVGALIVAALHLLPRRGESAAH